jgi:SAM-dependent methyltransferase
MPDSERDGEDILFGIRRACWQWAALKGLVSVGVPERLRDGPLSVTELAGRCGADAPVLGSLLRTVAALGLLRGTGPGTFELTGAGRALLDGTARHALDYDLDPEVGRALTEIPVTVRTGRSPFTERYGTVYDYFAARPASPSAAAFDKLMTGNHGGLAAELVKAADFGGLGTVVDLGGGAGTFLAAILRAHRQLRGVLVELDRAVPAATRYLAAQGVGDRAEVVAGDFFTAVPAGADVYLLAHVLHNWDDAHAVQILRGVRAAMPDGARVMLVELLLPDDDTPHFGKDRDVLMITMHGGRERGRAEYDALLTAAGFTPAVVTSLGGGTSVLTAGPASEPGYLFDNARAQAPGRFGALEASFDVLTQRHLAARGLRPGWRCLEVGAGSGSVARWLAGQVGADGYVLATDIDARWTDGNGLPNLEIAEHDIVSDPLPAAAFDLIHARLVLVHLPARDEVLTRLAAALKPGGWLVVEDFESSLPQCLSAATAEEHVFVKVAHAIVEALHRRGADMTYPRTLPGRLRRAGLTAAGASGHLVFFQGGTPEAALHQANIEQVGPALVAAGLATEADIGIARRLLRDPAFTGIHPLLITAWGRK